MSLNSSNVSARGLGSMSFTWRSEPIPQEIAFGAINEAIKINLPNKTFINGGQFYGADNINLKYLKGFFEKYPEQRQHAIISIKGAVNLTTFQPTTDRKSILESIDSVLKYIPDLDIFEPARINPTIPLEDTIAGLDEAVDTGRIKAYTLSEISATTLEKAYNLAKHKPVGAEIEFSLFTRDIIQDGLAAVAGKLDIPLIAYSPLSRGFLSGEIRKKSDIPEGDIRHHLERFSEENITKNVKIVEYLETLAKEKGVTTAQLALAWIYYHSGKTINGVKFPKIIPIPSSSSISRVQENFTVVELKESEFSQINEYISDKTIYGHRYNEHAKAYLSV